MICVHFVEEFQMERCGGLTVDFAARTGLHGHGSDRKVTRDRVRKRVEGFVCVSSSSFYTR